MATRPDRKLQNVTIVSKQVKNGRTISEIDRLGSEERVKEIARMLGGQSTAARQHAEELLGSVHG